MKDVEIIGLIKTSIKQTLVGMGALKGAACQITSIVDSGTSHVITFSWEDNSGVTHTNTLTLVDGADEVDELKDISITNLLDGQVLAWDNTSHKWVNTANSSTVASINNIGDVTVTNVTNGQILEWDDTASKWVNASLGTAAKKDSINAVTENSTDVVESGAVYTAIDDAVKALDVSDTAVAGSYVTEVSETDGKISVTREAADATPTENSNKLVKSSGVYSAIDDAVKALDVSDTAVAGSYVTEVSETDGKISVTREAADAAPTENSNKLVKSGGVYTAIDDAVKALDVSDTAVVGSYVTEVSETDGKISVTREAADAAPTENSNKLVKSGGVYAELEKKQDSLTAGDGIEIDAQNNIKVVKRLIVTDTMPTAGADYVGEGKQRLYVGANTQDYKKGGIYDCVATEEGGVTTYSWTIISTAEVDLTKYKKIFEGTSAAWEALTLAEKTTYDLAMITDDADNGDISQAVESGNLHPVSSDAVYDSEQEIYEVMGQMGAKNLLPNIASSGSYASSGTVTKNANGSLTINGTFDAVTTINIDYLNGLPNAVFDVTDLVGTDITVKLLDTAVSGITLQVGYFNSEGTRISLEGVSTKANITFPIGAVKSATYLRIASGTYDNVTVYPMMQLASVPDNTYAPYAMSNAKLTEKVEEIDAQLITWESKNYTWTPQGVNTTQQLSASGFGFSSISDIVSVIVDSGSTNAAAAYCTPLNGGTISFYLRQHANISTVEMTGRVVVGYKKSS